MDLDQLEIVILGKLYTLQDDVLTHLCTHLNVTKEGKTKRNLLKEVRAAIESKTSGAEESVIRLFLETIAGIIREPSMPDLEGDEEEREEEHDDTAAKKELERLVKEQQELREKVADLSLKVKKRPDQVREITDMRFNEPNNSSLLRREFKISGTIGQPGETNKLNFISLVHQIEGALAKGYSEVEVNEAIIRSISPGLPLRSFLECTPDLPLSKLRKILRSHYREKSSTELYKALSTLTQAPNEDTQAFLFRALELRQRVIFTCKEADSKIKYDQSLIQNLFLHSIETGLRDESVRSKLRPFLQNQAIPDEELIAEMNVIFSEEQEREAKLGKKGQKYTIGRVENITQVAPAQEPCIQPTDKKKPPESEKSLEATLSAVQAGLSELKASFEEFKAKPTKESEVKLRPPKRPPRGCESCVAQNKPEECTHCFICGDSSHFAYGCRKRNTPKNGRGLWQPRGNP